jgi:hypothetical protein
MLRKLGLGAALLGIVAISALAFAPAQTTQASSGDITLVGKGVLGAHGTGLVAVNGHVREMHLNANRGILLVKDIAGDAEVDVRGVGGTGEWNGFDVYYGTGAAEISGSHVAVIVVGTDIDLRVAGKGWAFLKGRGYFFVNGEGPFPWHTDGNFAPVDDGTTPDPAE